MSTPWRQRSGRLRIGLAFLVLCGVVGAAQVGKSWESSAARMTEAARQFLLTLTPDQRPRAYIPFSSPERFTWHFVPLQNPQKEPTRKGLRLEVMNPRQRQAALELIKSGLSNEGFATVSTIFSLEDVLHDQEKGRGPVRNPGWYFISVFGEPQSKGTWGWRVDGHHVALNFTLENGKITSTTPTFLGSNPGEVKTGARQGTRPLGKRVDLAADLARSLDHQQQSQARQEKHFSEVKGQTRAAEPGSAKGLPARQMSPAQQALLRQLLEQYLLTFAKDLADEQRQRMEAAGLDQLTFAYSGKFAAGEAVTYRIQGPELLVEFLNVQSDGAGNKNNHYHSSLRKLPTDFTP